MPRNFALKVITTNRLVEGDAVYLTQAGKWSSEFADAEVFADLGSATSALEKANEQTLFHIGAYLADAEIDPSGRPRPIHYREQIRSRGPSNYFHGKQAEAANV
ncbi:MAG: DUF2849 domain-containing protein [Albidovulum sp.]|nr:DUF2849 domain-containing protein [Albidovulum sp.]MDE0305504.1 DUF2849 domain-containing protein [Albidovulum sp.]MDE0533407.1 DUF2849 domain-containing protein [Albidovulum sp.]